MCAHPGLRATYTGDRFAFGADQLCPRECRNPSFIYGYDHYAAIYNDLVAFGPYINQALATLRHAPEDAHIFAATAEVLVTRFRQAANPLSTLSTSGNEKTALSSVAGLGWDWVSMHWAIAFLFEQQALASSVDARLPKSVATLLACLLEVIELVGFKSLYVVQDVLAPAVDQMVEREVVQAVIRDQSFEEARSTYHATEPNESVTSCGQELSGENMQATVLDRSFEEARSEHYALRNPNAVQPPASVTSRVQPTGSSLIQPSSTSAAAGGFASKKLHVSLGQPSMASSSGNSLATLGRASVAPPALIPVFDQRSVSGTTTTSTDQKADMFANLMTHFKSDKSRNLFRSSVPKPVSPPDLPNPKTFNKNQTSSPVSPT
jgi:hypothetical protein